MLSLSASIIVLVVNGIFISQYYFLEFNFRDSINSTSQDYDKTLDHEAIEVPGDVIIDEGEAKKKEDSCA